MVASLVAGLSNEEFASTFRAVPFPFQKRCQGDRASRSIHGSHGKIRDARPVRTFAPYKIGNEMQLLAAYTCTPLVQFSLKELGAGRERSKGKTDRRNWATVNGRSTWSSIKETGRTICSWPTAAAAVMKINTEKIAEGRKHRRRTGAR
jgi:hypothetical protein